MTYAEKTILTISPKSSTSCLEYVSLRTPWLYRRRTVKSEFWRHRTRRTPSLIRLMFVGGWTLFDSILESKRKIGERGTSSVCSVCWSIINVEECGVL